MEGYDDWAGLGAVLRLAAREDVLGVERREL